MSAKFLALALLVQLYVAGQAANFEAIKHSNSNDPGQNDGVSEDVGNEDLILEKFTWRYSSTQSKTFLTVCTTEHFASIGQTVKQVTLFTTISGDQGIDCEGVFDDTEKKCATFTEADKCAVNIPSGTVTYQLKVLVSTPLLPDVDKSVTATFTTTVEAATLTCGSKTFVRATGIANAVIDSCVAPGVDDVCYKSGNLFFEPFCFTVTDSEPAKLTLCVEGDNHDTANANGELAINELAYSPDGSATFSLTHTLSGTAVFEAIVLKDQEPWQSYSVAPVVDSSGKCTLADFTGDHAKYEVCTILPVTGGFQTAISSITDLDVQAEVVADSLQFRFTNANPDMTYVAKIDENPPVDDAPTVNIDCTGVAQDHICYGFLDGSPSHAFLTIEYLAADGTTSNKIAIPNPGFPRL